MPWKGCSWTAARKKWLAAVFRRCVTNSSGYGRTHNVGLLAHIDAGKTTTTERMAYYAGVTSCVGSVDSGSAIMDYLPPERERGITISTAALSLPWSGCSLNLVDTPGHVDFTFEVERTLRVLDGAVLLLDAVSGVEAQTVAVWRQARALRVPCIAFVNKMDNPRANLHGAVGSIKQRLGAEAVLTQLPVGSGREFVGVVDLVHMCVLLWPQGGGATRSITHAQLEDLPDSLQHIAHCSREQLLDQVAMADDGLAAVLLDSGEVKGGQLSLALQRACSSGALVPVLCGSAVRGVAIQPLMDAVTAYLPDSTGLAIQIPAAACDLCVYTFKQVYDVHRGLLAYVRVFSGSLRPHTAIYNASRKTWERVTKVLMAQADKLQEVQEASEGEIVVVVGFKHTFTGDVLVKSPTVAKLLESGSGLSLLAPPTVPSPVFLCTVEPSSSTHQRRLEQALQSLSREDPSLHVSSDPDSGQPVLSGMGELHLEMVEERLRRVYGVACELGQLQVAYRETLLDEARATVTLQGGFGSPRHPVTATVLLSPQDPTDRVSFHCGPEVKRQRHELAAAVESSLSRGPLLGFPVRGVAVCVEELTGCGLAPSPLLCACLSLAVQKALERASIGLLEPLTELEVIVPEQFVGAVLTDLTSVRRAIVKGVFEGADGQRVVAAQAPLASLLGYAKELRSVTSGTANFSMSPSGHHLLDSHQQRTAIEQLRGY